MEPDHKELLIGLLGNTYGDLRKLDESIIGSSSTLNRRSEALKQELTKVLASPVAMQPQLPPQMVPVQPPIQQPPQVQVAPPVQFTPQVPVDPNQLEFDLEKRAKYDDIVNRLDEIDVKLANIVKLIEGLSQPKPAITREKKKKVSGITQSSDYNQE